MKSDSKKQNDKSSAENKKTHMCKLACIADLNLYLFTLAGQESSKFFLQYFNVNIYTILTNSIFKQCVN